MQGEFTPHHPSFISAYKKMEENELCCIDFLRTNNEFVFQTINYSSGSFEIINGLISTSFSDEESFTPCVKEYYKWALLKCKRKSKMNEKKEKKLAILIATSESADTLVTDNSLEDNKYNEV